MKRKTNTLPDFKHTPPAPEPVKKTLEETAADVLATIRMHEPEDQNEVVKIILSELAADRHNCVKGHNEASARAAKAMDTFMCYAQGIEKLLALKMEEKK